ncbi:damage-inducible protein DinB [Pedobacter lusitanus]|uniref:Damage-inducible protein DinB n=1 Tax=Pedobacter lusitanus TaxID=1503925 RepID=A0A0D0GPI2_9SPHI|nr:DinB family protein [Pedobacter lusitanus]KIO78110.1 damage-inducible protein DinB [Pedobacter lusitanus]
MIYRKGAAGGLLDEYERAITDLSGVIAVVSDAELISIADEFTLNEDCRSIQTVLSHVVSSAYSYAIYIQSLSGVLTPRPAKIFQLTAAAYIDELKQAFLFTVGVFELIKDDELERSDAADKIMTGWGQLYDIEQLMEHAIVHILRHRRQIERFILLIRKG